MSAKSDINDVIDDPTKQLTDADIDPIGSATKDVPKWVDQGKAANERKVKGTHATLNQLYVQAEPTEYDKRLEALAHANELGTKQDWSQGDVLACADAYLKFLKGENDGAPS